MVLYDEKSVVLSPDSLSTGAAVQMLTFVCLLAVISTRVEICKELNRIVTALNLHHGQLVKHPHTLLSF